MSKMLIKCENGNCARIIIILKMLDTGYNTYFEFDTDI